MNLLNMFIPLVIIRFLVSPDKKSLIKEASSE